MGKVTKRKNASNSKNQDSSKTSTNGSSSAIENNNTVQSSILETETNKKRNDAYGNEHPHSKHSITIKKKLYESRRVIFILGIVLGLLATALISTMSHPNIRNEIDRIVKFDGMNDFLDDWKDIFPTSLQSLVNDIPKTDDQLHNSADSFSVGKRMMLANNLTSKNNVVMVPGVISTGIESWGTSSQGDCPSINHFRKRLWGSFYMLKTMILDKNCWLKHIMLDPETGLDPPNIKLRAAQGFEAADFFMAGYWIWSKILENLAVIGYTPNNMVSASYDWRLAYLDLEKRDGYFSKLQRQIELTNKLNGEKSILVGHSMGSQVIYYFMKWVEASGEHYGNGGPSWCNDNIEAFIDISGTLLGTPKAIPSLLSGEMRDTIQLNALAVYGLEKFFSRKERAEMLRTFGGIPSMIPKGGDLIWGNLTYSPDDPTNTLETNGSSIETEGDKTKSFGTFIEYEHEGDSKKFTLYDSIDYLLNNSPQWFSDRVRDQYSYGLTKDLEVLKKNDHIHSKWSNPLESRLPYAPDMKIFCFYGVGKPTERAYTYTKAGLLTNLSMTIDQESDNPVYLGDGDGTVSLMSHSVCHEWKKGSQSRFNPANISVTIVEIKDEPDRFDIRGGAKTADHVDILGSAEMNELILKVVSGQGDQIEDRYISNLHQIVDNLDI